MTSPSISGGIPRALNVSPPNIPIGSSHVRIDPALNSAALTRALAARNAGLFVRASSANRRINSVETTVELVGIAGTTCSDAKPLKRLAPKNRIVANEFIKIGELNDSNGHKAPAENHHRAHYGRE